ncbi:MAG: TetR/AcrR family transcriptional regulator, partial [Pricia sp.]
LTEATGLTTGAIYGNFENKEALALSAYEYNSKLLLAKLDEVLGADGSAMDKVFALTDFYKNYDTFTQNMGGCPILNTGVDAVGNNRLLAAANREAIKEIEGKIALVLENGVNNNELKLPVTPLQFAKQMFTIIQGAVAMSTMTRDRKYLINTIVYLNVLVKRELKKS